MQDDLAAAFRKTKLPDSVLLLLQDFFKRQWLLDLKTLPGLKDGRKVFRAFQNFGFF